MQRWLSREHEIVYTAVPHYRYSVYVHERSTGACLMSLNFEYWQEAYARQSLQTLVSMSHARPVTVPHRRTNKKSV